MQPLGNRMCRTALSIMALSLAHACAPGGMQA